MTTRRRVATVLLGLPLLAAACADDATDDGDAAAADTTEEAAAVDPVHEELAGRYAHYDVVAYEGSGMKTLIISYGFTDYEPVDGELVSQDSFCFSEHRSDSPITVQMSDEATQAIRPVPVAVDVTTDGDDVSITRPFTPTGLGVELEDPANDPLPTDPNDPRLVDADGDGNPGVTVTITVSPELSGELYLARREIFSYEVDLQADDSLTGRVIDESEQLIIGASNPVFMNAGQWEQHPDPALSPIILIPVEGEWDCDRLRAERDDLFPPTPEVNW
jgi:hypothetical protein